MSDHANAAAVSSANVEHVLDGNNDLEGGINDKDDTMKEKRHKMDGGWLPARHQNTVLGACGLFVITFLADFAAKAAWNAYLIRWPNGVNGPHPAFVNSLVTDPHKYRLLFHTNVVMAAMYLPCALAMALPFTDKLFWSLFWREGSFPANRSCAKFLMKNMAFFLVAMCVTQLLFPANIGVSLVGLCVNCAVLLNFLAVVVFDFYEGVVNRALMWSGFVILPFVWTGLFCEGLARVDAWNYPWKMPGGRTEQPWNFYLVLVWAVAFLPCGLINAAPGGADRWFLSFFFKEASIPRPHSPGQFCGRTFALMCSGLCIAGLAVPLDKGVGLAMFFASVMVGLNCNYLFFGGYDGVINKALWVGFAASPIVFAAMFGYELLNKESFIYPKDITDMNYRPWK